MNKKKRRSPAPPPPFIRIRTYFFRCFKSKKKKKKKKNSKNKLNMSSKCSGSKCTSWQRGEQSSPNGQCACKWGSSLLACNAPAGHETEGGLISDCTKHKDSNSCENQINAGVNSFCKWVPATKDFCACTAGYDGLGLCNGDNGCSGDCSKQSDSRSCTNEKNVFGDSFCTWFTKETETPEPVLSRPSTGNHCPLPDKITNDACSITLDQSVQSSCSDAFTYKDSPDDRCILKARCNNQWFTSPFGLSLSTAASADYEDVLGPLGSYHCQLVVSS